jgi:hypothetical protein
LASFHKVCSQHALPVRLSYRPVVQENARMENKIKNDSENPNRHDEPNKLPHTEIPHQKHKPHPNEDNPLEPKQGI